MAKRLIDIAPYENLADATVCQIQVYRSGNGYCDVMNFKTEAISTVDAVEVVRCKDCNHVFICNCPSCRQGVSICCGKYGTHMIKDDFCSYGEPKDGGQAPQREAENGL